MAQEINLGGTIYISSRRGAEVTGYSQDYIGQLARSGLIDARRVSGLWYVLESSLINYKEKAEQFIPTPPQKMREIEREVSVSFEGKEYISASRASEISGYNPDYVTQLAREGKILAHQSENRWYVDRESLIEHKKEKDALLAAVQSKAVGIRDNGEIDIKKDTTEHVKAHFTYIEESPEELLPIKHPSSPGISDTPSDQPVEDEETPIPIRIVGEHKREDHEKVAFKKKIETKISFPLLFGILGMGIALLMGILFINGFGDGLVGLKNRLFVPEELKELLSKELFFSRGSDF